VCITDDNGWSNTGVVDRLDMADLFCRPQLFGRWARQREVDDVSMVISETDVVRYVSNPSRHMAQDRSAQNKRAVLQQQMHQSGTGCFGEVGGC